LNHIDVKVLNGQPAMESLIRARLSLLVESRGFDLTRLEGVTVAGNFVEALAHFDDGGIENGRSLTITRGATEGVGVTPLCLRNGTLRCHIFLPAQLMASLYSGDGLAFKISSYVLTHEAAHAHDVAQRAQRLEPDMIKVPLDPTRPPVFWQLGDVCWNEYAASRFAAFEYPEMLKTFEEMFVRAILDFEPIVDQITYACRKAGTSKPAFPMAVEAIYPVLKQSAYLLGHLDGLSRSVEDLGGVQAVLKQSGLTNLIVDFSNCLREMWTGYPAWKDISAYNRLHSFLRSAFAACAIEVYEEQGQLKSRLILSMVNPA
jgi:hypothetical protein